MNQAKPTAITKQFDIINLEGTLLGLFSADGNPDQLYLSSFLKGKGNLFYATNRTLLKRFIASEITINELFQLSESELVWVTFINETHTFIKSSLSPDIHEGDKYYRDFPDHSKSKPFENAFR
jgi:hypothetical protein